MINVVLEMKRRFILTEQILTTQKIKLKVYWAKSFFIDRTNLVYIE